MPDGTGRRMQKRSYFGLTSMTFKERYYSHMSDFRSGLGSTTLSAYIIELDRLKIGYNVKWKIREKAQPFTGHGYCRLCLAEKMNIMFGKSEGRLLNKKDEINAGCRHTRKYRFES